MLELLRKRELELSKELDELLKVAEQLEETGGDFTDFNTKQSEVDGRYLEVQYLISVLKSS